MSTSVITYRQSINYLAALRARTSLLYSQIGILILRMILLAIRPRLRSMVINSQNYSTVRRTYDHYNQELSTLQMAAEKLRQNNALKTSKSINKLCAIIIENQAIVQTKLDILNPPVLLSNFDFHPISESELWQNRCKAYEYLFNV